MVNGKIIKVCGMREAENIQEIESLQDIDMLGFIFYPKSPRYVYELPAYLPIHTHLRTITETKGWTGLAPELVRKFVLNGGYRVYPTYVIMPYEASAGQTVSISHSWRNTGYGYLPNNMKNWNYKYKPAFALFDESGKLVKSWIDEDAEPSQWLSNQRKNYTYEVSLDGISRGNYQWAVAIVDKTKDNQPGINIGIKDKEKKDGWTFISEMTIK